MVLCGLVIWAYEIWYLVEVTFCSKDDDWILAGFWIVVDKALVDLIFIEMNIEW